MKIVKAYINLANGKQKDYPVKVDVKQIGDVQAVYMDGFSNRPLDGEFGAGIEIAVQDGKEWMADYRHSEYWCCPAFGTEFMDVPGDTQGLIIKKENGAYGVFLPVVSEQYKCVLEGLEKDTLLAKLFSWYDKLTSCRALAFLYAEGNEPYELLEKCCKAGLELLGTGYRTRKERRYPELFEYLGWCSWDAFEIRVDEQSLLAKCREFQDKDIPVKWAIIDDMWAEVHDFYGVNYENRSQMFKLMHASKLYSFNADPVRFPNGLKHCIEKMKEFGLSEGSRLVFLRCWSFCFSEGKRRLPQKGDSSVEGVM